MIFSSYPFILMFLPIVFTGYFVLGHFKMRTLQKIWLIIASFFFYSQGSPDFFPFFLGSVTANYVIGCALNTLTTAGKKTESRIVLILGVLANCGLLGYFKYTDFFLSNYGMLTGTHVDDDFEKMVDHVFLDRRAHGCMHHGAKPCSGSI